jgi:hypothetical protein
LQAASFDAQTRVLSMNCNDYSSDSGLIVEESNCDVILLLCTLQSCEGRSGPRRIGLELRLDKVVFGLDQLLREDHGISFANY